VAKLIIDIPGLIVNLYTVFVDYDCAADLQPWLYVTGNSIVFTELETDHISFAIFHSEAANTGTVQVKSVLVPLL
jgi:uncharacterized membrane protein